MKITGETPLTKTQQEGIKKDEKGKSHEASENSSKASVSSQDVVTLAGASVAGTEPVSKSDALSSLSAFIRDLKQNPQSADTLHQPIDAGKAAQLLQA